MQDYLIQYLQQHGHHDITANHKVDASKLSGYLQRIKKSMDLENRGLMKKVQSKWALNGEGWEEIMRVSHACVESNGLVKLKK